MHTEGRMQLVSIRKDKGNAFFAAGQFRKALGWYGRSMTLIGTLQHAVAHSATHYNTLLLQDL